MSETQEPRPWLGWLRASAITALFVLSLLITFGVGWLTYLLTVLPLNTLFDVSGWEIPSVLLTIGIPFALAYRARRVWWLYSILIGVTVGQCLLLLVFAFLALGR